MVDKWNAVACNVWPSLTNQTKPLLQKREESGELCIQTVSYWNAIRYIKQPGFK